MTADVVAVLVGVAAPAPFTYRGLDYRFHSLDGVMNDLRWYEALIEGEVPADRLRLRTLTAPAATTVAALQQRLAAAAASTPDDGTFILVLVGHGFQAADDDNDEEDRLDELFAGSDGPVVDDFFGTLWTLVPATANVVVFADTCSSDGLAIRGGEVLDPVIAQTESGPSRMFVSASMSWEEAQEAPTRNGVRGAMSLALEDAWNYVPESRSSYLAWFNETVQLLSVRRPGQHPRLRYVGPNQELLTRVPFT